LNGKKELDQLHNPINFTITENYYRDFRNEGDLSNTQIVQTVKEAKKIMKTAISLAEVAKRRMFDEHHGYGQKELCC
jgi:hypothetical protein